MLLQSLFKVYFIWVLVPLLSYHFYLHEITVSVTSLKVSVFSSEVSLL